MSSALVLGLWSIVVQPGQAYPQKINTAIQITNISFGAEVEGDKRAVVTLKYPEFEQDDSDDDSDEEEDDDEDSDEEIKLPNLITKEAVIAILKPSVTEQVSLNVSLVEDVEIVEFTVSGDNPVHIVGHYIRQEDFDQDPYSDDDDEFDSDEDDDDEDIDSELEQVMMEDSEEDEEEEERFEEVEEKSAPAPISKKRAAEVEEDDDVASALLAETSLSKNQKKKLAKKLKGTDGVAVAVPAVVEKKEEKKDDKPEVVKKNAPQTLAGGLVILDAKKGTGPVAKSGKKVSMRYIGKLDNGKIFDSNTKGAPLNFTLGRGEVIKGWDQGIVGMAVGGERKLTIPAALAYGKKGTQGIPGNSTLNFEVKLLAVK